MILIGIFLFLLGSQCYYRLCVIEDSKSMRVKHKETPYFGITFNNTDLNSQNHMCFFVGGILVWVCGSVFLSMYWLFCNLFSVIWTVNCSYNCSLLSSAIRCFPLFFHLQFSFQSSINMMKAIVENINIIIRSTYLRKTYWDPSSNCLWRLNYSLHKCTILIKHDWSELKLFKIIITLVEHI